MNIESFIKIIEEEFDHVKPGKLRPESDFRKDLGWDSMNALTLIAIVNVEYDVILDAGDLRKSNTLNDLFNIIETKSKS
jgi:acyl carrier protein